MLAYVFWHWKKNAIPATEYERRQREFHERLCASPPKGFQYSFSVGLRAAPWTVDLAYEDWYLVEDFGALGLLNEGAVSGELRKYHEAAANAAEGGTGGLYRLRHGSIVHEPKMAYWFAKPAGMSYTDCFDELLPAVDDTHGALWMRQLTLGPAKEFCVHARETVSLPSHLNAIEMPLRKIWDGSME